MDFEASEDVNGVRLSWNIIPNTSGSSKSTIVPIGALYTPLKQKEDLAIVEHDPIRCNANCKAVLNPFCQIDLRAKIWICPFCLARNALPTQYQNINVDFLPTELKPESSTVEYISLRPVQNPPIFFFVIDLCQDEDNLAALKDTLIISLSVMPPNALVGVITYGTMVQVHDLGYETCPKSYVFRGDKEYPLKTLNEMLSGASPDKSSLSRFFLPLQEVEFQLSNLFENLKKDPWPVASNRRPIRSTGAAVSIAATLLQASFSGFGARIMLFSAGPGTLAPGMVVGPELKEPIRSHNDIDKESAKHYKKSKKFYDGLAERISANGHCVDIFGCCYDQIGMSEMQSLSNVTGGALVLSDAFTTFIFKQSFLRLFDKDEEGYMKMGFNATFEVKTSNELKISGLIGHATSLKTSGPRIADAEIGIGGTSAWKLCSVTPNHTYAVYFESNNTGHGNTGYDAAYTQFITSYQHGSGTYRTRVTTIRSPLSSNGEQGITESFDQEAAAVLMSRIAVFKAEHDDGADVLRWIDRMLIRLCQRFGDYQKDNAESFRLSPQFSLYPQFMFYLRRSQFLQVFNNSPDETAFYRHVLTREDTTNSLIMIQPTLTSFSMQDEPEPVLLDSVSVKPDRILLLDTFFHILIYRGETIAAWYKAGYQENPEYEDFKSFLEDPKAEAAELLVDRFPLPRFIDTEAGGSQARFLFSRLNPSNTYQQQDAFSVGAGSAVVLTDDVSLQTFMAHLQKLAVSGTS
ncbi:GTPase-activating protein [Saccharomycopsis crataegensis]|uniref:Protein transport protein SEC23 n=1 Tax=Saccharomycopsis crataegensis TaxID=43959 RepID=A0AAV5QHX8_9ASCO|nr:GTPase-activating protein [Saccharomycopsis crataegensis]